VARKEGLLVLHDHFDNLAGLGVNLKHVYWYMETRLPIHQRKWIKVDWLVSLPISEYDDADFLVIKQDGVSSIL
jgi:hypothetical protein